jgi:hypothetical protein
MQRTRPTTATTRARADPGIYLMTRGTVAISVSEEEIAVHLGHPRFDPDDFAEAMALIRGWGCRTLTFTEPFPDRDTAVFRAR